MANKPTWAVRRLGFNLGKRHSEMLDELVAGAEKSDHRASITTVMEHAIEHLYVDGVLLEKKKH